MAKEAQLTTVSVLLRLSRAVAAACDATRCAHTAALGLRPKDVLAMGRAAVARLAHAACRLPDSHLEPFLDSLRRPSARTSWIKIRDL